MNVERWMIYSVLAAVLASVVGLVSKLGLKSVDTTMATTLRSLAMTTFLLVVMVIARAPQQVSTFDLRAVAAIVTSGVAGALSWLFYFRAIQLTDVSKVAPIDKLSMPLGILLCVLILGERPTFVNWIGIALMTFGAYLAVSTHGIAR